MLVHLAIFGSRSADGGPYSSNTFWVSFVIFICHFAPPHDTSFSFYLLITDIEDYYYIVFFFFFGGGGGGLLFFFSF